MKEKDIAASNTTLWTTIFMTLIGFVLIGCAPVSDKKGGEPETEGFAIYLLSNEITADEMITADIGSLEILSNPVFSSDDILSYFEATHEIELTRSGYDNLGQLTVPMTGLPFVVCVNRQPIYGGAFWVGYSSMSYQGIAIDILHAQQYQPIKIQLGYPESPELFAGEDKRAEIVILRSLEQENKLK